MRTSVQSIIRLKAELRRLNSQTVEIETATLHSAISFFQQSRNSIAYQLTDNRNKLLGIFISTCFVPVCQHTEQSINHKGQNILLIFNTGRKSLLAGARIPLFCFFLQVCSGISPTSWRFSSISHWIRCLTPAQFFLKKVILRNLSSSAGVRLYCTQSALSCSEIKACRYDLK